MKTIGLIGGMSWESTSDYYRYVNEEVKAVLGGLHSAKILIYSFDFSEIDSLQNKDDWETMTEKILDAALKLQNAGADLLAICTNTMHKIVPNIEKRLKIPLVHIADATGEEISRKNLRKVALLGTKFTMTQDFYKVRINEKFGIEIIVPDETDRETIHRIIYDELCRGTIKDSSREEYVNIIEKLRKNGAEGVILGCTEIPLLIKQEHSSIPIFDTTKLHSHFLVREALR